MPTWTYDVETRGINYTHSDVFNQRVLKVILFRPPHCYELPKFRSYFFNAFSRINVCCITEQSQKGEKINTESTHILFHIN